MHKQSANMLSINTYTFVLHHFLPLIFVAFFPISQSCTHALLSFRLCYIQPARAYSRETDIPVTSIFAESPFSPKKVHRRWISPKKFMIENESESRMIDHVQNILFTVMNSLLGQLVTKSVGFHISWLPKHEDENEGRWRWGWGWGHRKVIVRMSESRSRIYFAIENW